MGNQYQQKFIKILVFLAIINAVFVGTVAHADIQLGETGRNGGQHTGTIFCPNNEKITHFELAFDTGSTARDNVPYDMYINGVKVYSNSTPFYDPTLSGYNVYATTTLVSMSPVDCFGQATWLASSTSPTGEQIRIYFKNINTGTTRVHPSYTFSPPDRLSTLYLSTNPTDQNLVASKTRFANSVYYLSTSTSSGGGGGTTVNTIDEELQKAISFLVLLLIYIIPFVVFIYIMRKFYDRE